jgi:hypothetical protein
MTERSHQLAAHTCALDDYELNDLLVELPPVQFAALIEDAFAAPAVGMPVRFHPARPWPGEVTRWTVEARQSKDRRVPVLTWAVLGAVAQQRTTGPRGGTSVAWHAKTYRGERVGDPAGRGWPTRSRATAALLWHSPASGARCAALSAHIRALGDDALNDLLVELPPRRFAALLLAALQEGGVAA